MSEQPLTRKQIREAIYELLVERKELATVTDLVQRFFKPEGEYEWRLYRKLIKSCLSSIRTALATEGIPFGSVTPEGEFGIPQTKAQFLHMSQMRYKFVKGVSSSLRDIVEAGEREGLISAFEKDLSISVPKEFKDDR